MIVVDTNILVYAHRRETAHHKEALKWLTALAEGVPAWAIPVFCLGEFLRVVTHARLFDPPSRLSEALDALAGLLASPSVRILNPGDRYPGLFADTVREADARGNLVFDAQIAALCREHGCNRLLTLDRDFARFRNLKLLSIADSPDTSR